MADRILVGTRKGTFLVTKSGGRWRPRLAGHPGAGVNFVARDPNTGTLWAALGHTTTLAYEPWPKFDPALTKADEIEVPVQVNGKLRSRLLVPAEIDDKSLEAAALADAKVQEAIAGKPVKLVKVVPKRLVNVVLAG